MCGKFKKYVTVAGCATVSGQMHERNMAAAFLNAVYFTLRESW